MMPALKIASLNPEQKIQAQQPLTVAVIVPHTFGKQKRVLS